MKPERREEIDTLFAEIDTDLESQPANHLTDEESANIKSEFTKTSNGDTIPDRIRGVLGRAALPPHK